MNLNLLILFVLAAIAILYFFPDMDAVMKKIIYFIAIVCTIIWFLGIIGVWRSPYLT